MRTRRVLDTLFTVFLRLTALAALVVLFVFWAAHEIGGPWCHPDIVGCVGWVTYDDVYDTVMATVPR